MKRNSIEVCVCLSVCLFVLWFFVSVCPPVYLYVCLSVCLCVCSVCQSVTLTEFSRLYEEYVSRVPVDMKKLLGLPVDAHGLLSLLLCFFFLISFSLSAFVVDLILIF